MMYSLNSAEIQEANSKAISLCANVPPYLPALEKIPIAPVVSTYFFGDMVNALEPAWILNPSNSTGLNSGLLSCSHNPRNSIVSRFRIQFLITSSGASFL